jgi:hypothetical protein
VVEKGIPFLGLCKLKGKRIGGFEWIYVGTQSFGFNFVDVHKNSCACSFHIFVCA